MRPLASLREARQPVCPLFICFSLFHIQYSCLLLSKQAWINTNKHWKNHPLQNFVYRFVCVCVCHKIGKKKKIQSFLSLNIFFCLKMSWRGFSHLAQTFGWIALEFVFPLVPIIWPAVNRRPKISLMGCLSALWALHLRWSNMIRPQLDPTAGRTAHFNGPSQLPQPAVHSGIYWSLFFSL